MVETPTKETKMCLKIDPKNLNPHNIHFLAPESHIRTHAYHLWEKAGCPHDGFFWGEAEKECDYIIAYKIVKTHFIRSKPPEVEFRSPIVGGYYWKEGWNQSDRKYTHLIGEECLKGEINYGFHVYLDPYEAHKEASTHNTMEFVEMAISVHCHKNDFVAGGVYQGWFDSRKAAVFTKVFVPPHTLEHLKQTIIKLHEERDKQAEVDGQFLADLNAISKRKITFVGNVYGNAFANMEDYFCW